MELEELYSLLPKGSFSDFNSFATFVNENGAAAFYPLVDASIYPTEESFSESLKKKDLSKDMDFSSGDSFSDSFTTTRDGEVTTIEYDPYKDLETENPSSEFDKKFKANTKRIASGIIRLPLFMQEIGGSIRGTFDEDYAEFLKDMSVEERQDYYLATGISDFSDDLISQAEEIEDTMIQYETSITEDFGALKLSQALSRTFAEVGGALPSLATVLSNPFGFVMLGAGSAAEKSRSIQKMDELTGEDGGLTLKKTMNAIGTGIAEGAFELVTRGLGKNMFKVLRQLPKEQAKYTITKVAKEYAKGFGMEGASETLTLGTESVLDALLLDDEAAFEKSWYEYMDTFIIGGVVGAGMSGGSASIARLKQKRESAKLQKEVELTRYDKVEQPFLSQDFIVDTDIETLLNIPNSEQFLKGTLQGQVKRGDITQEQMDGAMSNYAKSVAIYNRVSDLGINPDKMNEALKLSQEKYDLEQLISKDKDKAAADSQIERINQIDERLKIISNESNGTPTDKDVEQEIKKADEQQQPYTLPEVVEQAKEDFEIIDNRGGIANLDILEDGSGKWYVLNKRTSTPVAFRTKADAQNELKEIVNGRSTVEFGEGEVIVQDITTTPTTTEIETVVEETNPENIVVRKNKVLRRLTDDNLTPEVRRKAFRNLIARLKPTGKVLAVSTNKLIKQVEKLDFSKPVKVKQALDDIVKAFETSKRKKQVEEAQSLFDKIVSRKNLSKTIRETRDAAEEFLKINFKEVTDIVEYINKASELATGLLPSKVIKGGLRAKEAANLKSITEYSSLELKEQKERLEQIERDVFEELTGKSSDDLSLAEIRRVSSLVEGKDKATQDDTIDIELGTSQQQLESSVRNGIEIVKRLISNQFDTGVNFFTGQELDISDADRALVEEFLDLDVASFSKAEALKAIDSLTEFATNGSTGGMQFIVDNAIGRENAKTLEEEGLKSQPLISYLTGEALPLIKKFAVLRGWAKNIATFPMMTELMFRGQTAANNFMNVSGLQTLFNKVADAKTTIAAIEKQYDGLYKKKKPNGKNFSDAENIYERGVLASIRRTVVGDSETQQREFERKKRLIFLSIENLKNDARISNTRVRQSELYQQVYDKLLKNSNSIQDVEDKSSRINLDAVQWMTNKWSEYYPQLRDVNLKIYNQSLEEDINYTPDVISTTDLTRTTDINKPIFESQEYLNDRRLYNEQTGVLKDNNRINSLGDNKFVNLDFDRANINSLRKAIININSASVIQQIQGFIKSDSFKKIIPDDVDRQLFNQRLTAYVADQRGINFKTQTQRDASEALDKLASIPIARALVSGGQFIKQLTPVVSTLFTAGPANTLEGIRLFFDPEVRAWLGNAGYSISNRGIASEALLDNAQKTMEKTSLSTNSEKLLDGLDYVNRKGLEYTLQSADVLAAKTSWMANYVKKMKELGRNEVTDNTFDWSTHEVNKEAADFAQQQVDRLQNVSDSSLQGAMFRTRNVPTRALLQVFLPFSNFLLNMKTRALSDTLTFFSTNSSTQDKYSAGVSATGYASELLAFNAMSTFLTSLNYAASDAITKALTGEEPDEEFRKKRDEYRIKGFATSLASDFLSPLPPLNPEAAKAVNFVIRSMYDDEDPFQLFVDEKSIRERLGLYTIAEETLQDVIETGKMAASGTLTFKNNKGEEVQHELSDEEKDLMYVNITLELLYAVGVLPAEVKRIIAQNKKALAFKSKKPLPKAPSYKRRKGSKLKSKRKSKL